MNPTPSEPTPPDSSIRAGSPNPPGPLGSLSADDLIALNEEIAGMARAGLPLDQGLAALAKEMRRGRLQSVTATLAADLKAGLTLPQALERQGGRVPPFYAGLVAAGIRTGRIGEVLATLTLYARTLADLRSNIYSALCYPLVVVVLAVLLFWLVFSQIIPQFDDIFRSFKLRLPLVTEWMFAVGRYPLQYLVIPPLSLVIAVLIFRAGMLRSPWGRRVWAQIIYSVPIVGGLIRSARLAAFTDLLGILVDHQVPLGEAFQLAGQACSDPMMAEGAEQVCHDLNQGRQLGEVLQTRHLVPDVIAWMTHLGEQRGNLGTTLHQVAGIYRRQVELRASLLRHILPPVLIIATAGVLVVLFVLAIMVPMLALLEGLGGGLK